MFDIKTLVSAGLFLIILSGALYPMDHGQEGASSSALATMVRRNTNRHVLDATTQQLINFLASQNDDAITQHLSSYSACKLAHFLTIMVATHVEQKMVDLVFVALAQKITEPSFLRDYDGSELTLPPFYDNQLKGIFLLHHLQKICSLSSTAKVQVLAALDNHEIVVRMPNNVVLVYNMRTQHCIHLPFSEQEPVKLITVSADGQMIVICTESGNLRVWNTRTHAVLQLNKEVDKIVTSIALSPDGSCVLIGFSSGEVVVWDVLANHYIRTLSGCEHEVTALAVTAGGDVVFAGSCDGAIYRWDMAAGSCQRMCQSIEPDSVITSLRLTRDGHYLVSYMSRGVVQVLDMSDSQHVMASEARVTLIPHLATTLGDACAIIGCDVRKKSLHLVHINTDTLLNDFSFSHGSMDKRIVALNNEGQLFTTSRDDKTITLWGCDIPAVEQLSLAQTLVAVKVRNGLIPYQEDQSPAGCRARVYGVIAPFSLQLTPQLRALYDGLPQITREHIERFASKSFVVESSPADEVMMGEEDVQEPVAEELFESQMLIPEYKLC